MTWCRIGYISTIEGTLWYRTIRHKWCWVVKWFAVESCKSCKSWKSWKIPPFPLFQSISFMRNAQPHWATWLPQSWPCPVQLIAPTSMSMASARRRPGRQQRNLTETVWNKRTHQAMTQAARHSRSKTRLTKASRSCWYRHGCFWRTYDGRALKAFKGKSLWELPRVPFGKWSEVLWKDTKKRWEFRRNYGSKWYLMRSNLLSCTASCLQG